jgi:hypothetical protein
VDVNGYLNINHTVFAGCHSNEEGGGGISIHGINNIIENSAFLFCVSWAELNEDEPKLMVGGGIRFWDTNGELKNCSFINCGSKTTGGALGHARFISNDDVNVPRGKLITLTNCIFASNWAEFDGGVIIMHQESYNCLNCSFLHNRAGGSGSVLAGELYGDVSFKSCIFVENWNNDSCNINNGRGAISLWPSPWNESETMTFLIEDSSFYNNRAADDSECTSVFLFIYSYILIFFDMNRIWK